MLSSLPVFSLLLSSHLPPSLLTVYCHNCTHFPAYYSRVSPRRRLNSEERGGDVKTLCLTAPRTLRPLLFFFHFRLDCPSMHVSFFLLLLLASYLPLASAAGNCSSLTPQSLSVGRQRITFGGLGVVLQPLVGSVPSTDYRVEWSFAWLVERNRTSHYVNGIPFSPSLCISPSDTAFRITPIPNPLEPGSPTEPCAEDSNIPCGALLSYIAGEDLDCWMEKKVEPFLNATRTSHYVHYSLPTAPTFELIAGFHLVDKNVTDYPLRNSTAITNEYMYVLKSRKTAFGTETSAVPNEGTTTFASSPPF